MLHLPRFWKHKESKEVIDHLTYSDLKDERSDFDECDVTGELLNGQDTPDVKPEETPEPPVVELPVVTDDVTTETPEVVNSLPQSAH
jgi:hypothetical protein